MRLREPALPEDVTAGALDPTVRRDLRGLQKDTAEVVARHLVAAGTLVDDDAEQALEHARYARHRASRIAVVREAAGIAAYHAGEWSEALNDLRAARRMGGGPGHLAVMADIERALGRPERALELARDPEIGELDAAAAVELAIVAAGARRDLGELDAAVVALQGPALDPARRDPWSPRLFYAYADNLLAAGREADAVQWFVHAADADEDGLTDAHERLAELTGEPLDVVVDDLDVTGRPAEDTGRSAQGDTTATDDGASKVQAPDAAQASGTDTVVDPATDEATTLEGEIADGVAAATVEQVADETASTDQTAGDARDTAVDSAGHPQPAVSDTAADTADAAETGVSSGDATAGTIEPAETTGAVGATEPGESAGAAEVSDGMAGTAIDASGTPAADPADADGTTGTGDTDAADAVDTADATGAADTDAADGTIDTIDAMDADTAGAGTVDADGTASAAGPADTAETADTTETAENGRTAENSETAELTATAASTRPAPPAPGGPADE